MEKLDRKIWLLRLTRRINEKMDGLRGELMKSGDKVRIANMYSEHSNLHERKGKLLNQVVMIELENSENREASSCPYVGYPMCKMPEKDRKSNCEYRRGCDEMHELGLVNYKFPFG